MHDRIYTRLAKIRKENPDFDKEMMNMFADRMPKLLDVLIDGKDYDMHIGTKEVAMLAEPYILNKKGENIGFHWNYEEVESAAKNFVDIDKENFYLCDLWVWANVKYGDLSEQKEEIKPLAIFEAAVNDLSSDADYPYYDPSHKAYYWLKKHIENDE